jgi:polysaccharide chain length determinant protein (PEP-CTERM system associated)
MVRHRKWWLIILLFVGWALVTAVSWIIPSKYVSDSLILIQRQTLSDKVVPPNVQIDLQQQLDTMTQRVLSRSNLKKLIDKFKLYPSESSSTPTDEVVDLMRKDIKIELVMPGQNSRRGNNDLTGFTVSYTGTSPTQAQQITQELTGLFIHENIQTTVDINRVATDFLTTQVEDAAKDLVRQETKLREFKSHFNGALPEQLQTNLQLLQGLQQRLQAAGDALNHAQQQETYLQSLLGQYGGSGKDDDAGGTAPVEIDQRLTAMRAELANLKTKYTDKHPDVVHLEQDIAATESLKKNMEKESLESGTAGANAATKGQSSLAQIKSQLKANELEIASRKRDIQMIEAQGAALQARLNQTPVAEQQLGAVQRNYEQSKANYDSLLAKKQAADLARDLVNQQQGDTLQLVDPASLPEKADFPNHFKFSLGGIAAGLALGLIIVGGRELINPMVYNEEQAATVVNAPILTAIPSLSTASEVAQGKRRSILQSVAAVLMLSLIPLGVVFAYYRG